MIANSTQLTIAVRQWRILEEALKALRDQLEAKNPDLLAVTEKAYVGRIASLQAEISHYLCDHPTAVSLLVDPANDLELTATNEMRR